MVRLLSLLILASCSASNSDTDEKKSSGKNPKEYKSIFVEAPEGRKYSCSIGADANSATHNGIGEQYFEVDKNTDIVVGVCQKNEPGDWKLRLVCYYYNDRRGEASTAAEYGVATTSCSVNSDTF